ncbi:MAG: DUF2167 domain-containing protein [Vulcanimicrobiaceae bacterium]
MRFGTFGILMIGILTPAILPCGAQESETNSGSPRRAIQWQDAGSIGNIGSVAEVTVPESCKFTGRSGVPAFLRASHNLPDESVAAVLLCLPTDSSAAWFVMFKFDESGLVRDNDKNALDADKLLASMKEATEQANEERERRGWDKMFIAGWITPPFYDSTTHNLTWALEGVTAEGESSVNREVRLLGRRGVLSAELVAEPNHLSTVVPQFDGVIGSTRFVTGQKYSEWREGDKVAAYGLVALIAGGAGLAAGKLGLLGKLWKLVAAMVVAIWKLAAVAVAGIIAWIKSLFKKKKPAAAG